MNILFIGDLNNYTRSYQRYNSLNEHTKNLQCLSHTEITNKDVYKFTIVEKLFIKLRLKYDFNNFNKKILNYDLEKIDLIWIDGTCNLKLKTIKTVKKINNNIKFLFFSEDDFLKKHNSTLFYSFFIKNYDYIFTTKKRIYQKLCNNINISLITDSFSKSLQIAAINKLNFNDKSSPNYQYDVVHIGAYEEPRFNSIIYLAKKGIKIDIWGNGWPKCDLYPNLKIHRTFLKNLDYIYVIKNSKINLNFLRSINGDKITSRSIEIPAYGGFILSEYSEEHFELYPDGIKILFKNNEDLYLKVVNYLNSPETRENIKTINSNTLGNEKYSIEFITKEIIAKLKK